MDSDRSTTTAQNAVQIQSTLYLRETFILRKNDYLGKFYYQSSRKSKATKLALSMMNSILHHRLIFFMVDHQLVNSLFANDTNHLICAVDHFVRQVSVLEKNHKLNNIINCKNAITMMKRKRIIREVGHATSFRPAVYEVIDHDMLKEISATDTEKQVNRHLAFAYRF